MADHATNFKDFKQSASQSDKFAAFLVFLVWPFLGLLLSFKHYKFRNSVNVFWFFNIFVGLTFGFSEGADSDRYVSQLEVLHSRSSYSLSEFWEYLVSEGSGTVDIVQPLINFLVSRVTDSGYILFAVYGFVYGFFYSRNVWYMINKIKGKVKVEALAFLVLLAFLLPFWSMNGFRFWTATHIFFYGIVRYFEGDKKGLFFIVLTLFVHYTYVLGVGLFLGYLLVGNRILLYFVVYIVSIFFSFVNLEFIGQYVDNLPVNVKERSSSYLNEEYAEGYFAAGSDRNWYIKYKFDFIKTLVASSFIWIFFARLKLIRQNPMMLKLFCIGLIFMAFANFVASVPSMLRFYMIGFMCVTLMLFLFFQLLKFKRRPDWYKFASIFFVFVYCAVELRSGLDFLTLATAIGNPFTTELFDKSFTLIKFIK